MIIWRILRLMMFQFWVEESIEWEKSDEGLKIRTPFKAPNMSAVVFKINTNDLDLIMLENQAEVMAPITVDG